MEPVWHDSVPFMWTLFTGVVAAAFAAGGAMTALNGTKDRVKEIHERLHTHIADESTADKHTHERIARVEAKVDLIHGLVNRK